MEESEGKAITRFYEIVEILDAMDIYSFDDTIKSIIHYYVTYFGREVIRPQLTKNVEFQTQKREIGDHVLCASATIYSNRELQEYTLALRIINEAEMEEYENRVDNIGDGYPYKFPEIIIDYSGDNGFVVQFVVNDLSNSDAPSNIYAFADTRGVEILDPSASFIENLLYRIQKHSTNAFLLSAFSVN